jgi:flavin-dependent dehydrogenase
MPDKTDFDVVICGGGQAGLTLSLQLRQELPELSIAVIDRLTSPFPEAAFKVGESTIELATYYLGQVLKLEPYFHTKHLPKLGPRFFMGGGQGPLTARPETGLSLFPPLPSYQVDRGRLENDLRKLVVEAGIILFDGTVVEDIELAEGEQAHTIRCRRKDGSEGFSLSGRWVIDALGRRRMLQTKLGLKRENEHHGSSSWWRYAGRIDIDKMGEQDGESWRHQMVEDRYYSTNHLMGPGYWVWLIPLSSDATSVGIVTDDDVHPHNTYGKSYAQSLEWLQKYEPKLAEFIQGLSPLDFMTVKRYSYGSAQLFSHRRWTCVGESGFFLDPMLAYGADFIAVTNTLTVELIRRDKAGTLTEAIAADYNRLLLENLYPICLSFYEGMYRIFGHAQIFTSKLTWDTAIYFSWMYHLYVQGVIKQPTAEVFALGERFRLLNAQVEHLLADWSEKAPPRPLHIFGDLTRMRLMMLLGLDLASRRSPEQMMIIAHKNLDRLEELAIVLFWQAVSECHPDHPALRKRPWVNAWRMHLDSEKWEADGVFAPETDPRPLEAMRDNFAGIFAPLSLREWLQFELPYQVLQWRNGYFYYKLVPWIRKQLFVNKPAMNMRWGLVRDYPAHK